MSNLLVVAPLAVALVGCARPTVGTSAEPQTSSTVGIAESEAPADAAHIVCAREAAQSDTPVVRAHLDGVRVVISNPGDAWGYEFHPVAYEYGQAMGGDFPRGGDVDSPWTIPPGEVIVACLPDARSTYFDPEVPTASFTVVDPDGLFVPWDLACGAGEQFRIRVEGSSDEDPAQVFRRVPGVLPSDDLRKPGYLGTPLHWPTLNVFREGEAIARIGAPRIGEEWELLVDACPGSGIERSSG
jgi:hypothetical protein